MSNNISKEREILSEFHNHLKALLDILSDIEDTLRSGVLEQHGADNAHWLMQVRDALTKKHHYLDSSTLTIEDMLEEIEVELKKLPNDEEEEE